MISFTFLAAIEIEKRKRERKRDTEKKKNRGSEKENEIQIQKTEERGKKSYIKVKFPEPVYLEYLKFDVSGADSSFRPFLSDPSENTVAGNSELENVPQGQSEVIFDEKASMLSSSYKNCN